MNRSVSEFALRFFFLFLTSTHVSDFLVGKPRIDLGAPFGFYSGHCFDRIVALFKSCI